MRKLQMGKFMGIVVLISLIIQVTVFQVPAFGNDKKPANSIEEENREAGRALLSIRYGNNWTSIPTDNDIKKAIEAYPKTLKRDDKFLGKPSYNEYTTTFKLGEAIKKHSTVLARENISNANHVFVKCTAVETATHHIYSVATGRTEVSTDTRQISGYIQLKQLSDGAFTLGKGEINNEIFTGFTNENGELLYADGWVNVKSDKYKLYGEIVDGNGKPLPYVYLLIMVNGKEVRVQVDSTGKYEYSFDTPNPMTEEAKKVRMRIVFSYSNNSKEWFKLVMNPRPTSAPDNIVTVINFDLDGSKKEMQKDINYAAADQGYISKTGGTNDKAVTNISSFEKLKKISVIYKNYYDAFKFAQEKLKVDFSNNIPLKIEVESSHPTVFDPYNKTIMLQDEHTLNVSSNIWTQHHEFGHYTQYTAYGKRFPSNAAHEGDPRNYPHWGYVNDDTGDSFIEGFANYFPCIAGKYGDNPLKEPDVLGVFGSINDPWSAWANEGTVEEFAFAGIMWDLSEKAKIPYQEVWDVFRTDRGTFYKYYEELIKRYKDKKQAIDSIYISRGVYAIKLEGNHSYDYSEPYIDSNGNGQWDSGEYFVDFSADPKTGDIYMGTTDDMVIGQSSNYERMDKRYSTYRFPNSYLKVDGNFGEALTVKVKYLDGSYSYSYTAPVYNGKIYMCCLPESLKAEISVVSASSNDMGKMYYKTTTVELKEKFKSTRDRDSLDAITIMDVKEKPAETLPVPQKDEQTNYFWILLAVIISVLLLVLGISQRRRNKRFSKVLTILSLIILAVSFYMFKEILNNPGTATDNKASTQSKDKSTVSGGDTGIKDKNAMNTAVSKTGKLYYESGILRYEGELSGETPNGKGIYYFENGKKQYEGDLTDGKADGKGIRYNEDGKIVYQGEFSKGSYQGYGILNYSNGDHYEGDFINSLPDGYGNYLWASGDKYVGEFSAGMMEGEGVLTRKDGTVYHDGLWSKGKRVSESPAPDGAPK